MAKIKLDARTVASLQVMNGREDFFDQGLTGFGIRVTSHKTKTWFVLYRIGGRKRRFKLGTYPTISLADARDRAKALLGEVATGTDPMQRRLNERTAETVEQLVNQYLESAKGKKISWKDDEHKFNTYLIPKFGKIKAGMLKKSDVMSILDSFSNKNFKVEPNRVLRVIRRLYNWGIERDLVMVNPCAGVKNPQKEFARTRVLTSEEIKTLWDTLDSEVVDMWSGTKKDKMKIINIFRLMLTTGQRGAEVKQMEWSEIDFANHMWTIPKEKIKTRAHQRVPLNDLSLRILKELKLFTGQGRYVFPSPYVPGSHIDNIQKATERLREDSSIADFSAHDLRRTVASHMTGMGIPQLVVKKILGHVCAGVTAVYDQHEYDFEKMRALRIWNERLSAILEGRFDFSKEEDKTVWLRVGSP